MQDAALDDLSHDDRNALANAIDEAWQPRFSSDDIALSKLGKVLAIAERLDTLAGGFAAGLKPTGNKDPFALRRNALGLARTIIESGFELKLPKLAAHSFVQAWASLAQQNARTKTSAAEAAAQIRSEEQTSELQSLMRISYAVFCLTKKKIHNT